MKNYCNIADIRGNMIFLATAIFMHLIYFVKKTQ